MMIPPMTVVANLTRGEKFIEIFLQSIFLPVTSVGRCNGSQQKKKSTVCLFVYPPFFRASNPLDHKTYVMHSCRAKKLNANVQDGERSHMAMEACDLCFEQVLPPATL